MGALEIFSGYFLAK